LPNAEIEIAIIKVENTVLNLVCPCQSLEGSTVLVHKQ